MIRGVFKNIYIFCRLPFLFLFKKRTVRKLPEIKEIKNVLIIRPDRLGDMVMTLPLINTLKENLKEAKIYLLCGKINASLLQGSGVFLLDEAKDIKKMCDISCDIAIDSVLDWRLKSAFLARKVKAKVSIGFDIGGRGRLFDIGIKPQKEKIMSEMILGLIKPIEIPITSAVPQLKLLSKDKEEAERYLKNIDLDIDKKIVVLHPGGHYPSQRWMPERFAEIGDGIVKHTGARIAIIASRDEIKIVQEVTRYMKEMPLGIIDSPLRILAYIFSKARLLIGNNSGPLHLAASVGTPTVSFMGPTDHKLWTPQGKNQIVLRKGLSCSPCNRGYCRKHDCLREITVSEVTEKARELWKGLYGDWQD